MYVGSNSSGLFQPIPLLIFDFYGFEYKFLLIFEYEMAAVQLAGKELMEPRLLALLQNNGIKDDIMDTLGNNEVVALNVFACLATSKEAFRELLERPPLSLKGDNMPGVVQQAKLIAAWEAANTTKEVEMKHTSERLVQNMPPQLDPGDLENAVKIFQKTEHELTKFTTPSKALFEALQGQIEGYFAVIPLTMVTSLDNQDTNQTSTYGLDITQGLLRATAAKPYAIPLPKNAESYRARLELLGTAWCFAKAKNPSKAQLRTISPRLFDAYVKWLFGPRVWGMTTNDEHGNVVATPHIGQVIAFDYQIRKRVADSMNSGVDMEAAFTEAKGDTETRMVHFLNVVSVGINSSECRACTAPDMCDRIKAKPIDTQRAPGKVQPPTTTKGQTAKAKKLRKKARDAELKEAGRAAQQGDSAAGSARFHWP